MSLDANAGVDVLVRASRGGDRAAFERLYALFHRMVHAIALSRVGPSDADDIVQDVFLSAMKQLHALRNESAFGGWLAAIARNCARGHHRAAAETVELQEMPMHATQEEEREAHHALATIRALPEAYRETLVLRLVEGMSGAEIAARTGLTPGSVRVNLHRGMQMLREALHG